METRMKQMRFPFLWSGFLMQESLIMSRMCRMNLHACLCVISGSFCSRASNYGGNKQTNMSHFCPVTKHTHTHTHTHIHNHTHVGWVNVKWQNSHTALSTSVSSLAVQLNEIDSGSRQVAAPASHQFTRKKLTKILCFLVPQLLHITYCSSTCVCHGGRCTFVP